jgi:transcriptional regulator with XRE-family HTH domain
VYFGHSAWVSTSPQRAFGERIRALRLARGLTQDDLAAHCGLFRTYMSRIETGQANPTLTMVHALATSLEVDVADLFAADPSDVAAAAAPQPRPRPTRGRVR